MNARTHTFAQLSRRVSILLAVSNASVMLAFTVTHMDDASSNVMMATTPIQITSAKVISRFVHVPMHKQQHTKYGNIKSYHCNS